MVTFVLRSIEILSVWVVEVNFRLKGKKESTVIRVIVFAEGAEGVYVWNKMTFSVRIRHITKF